MYRGKKELKSKKYCLVPMYLNGDFLRILGVSDRDDDRHLGGILGVGMRGVDDQFQPLGDLERVQRRHDIHGHVMQ